MPDLQAEDYFPHAAPSGAEIAGAVEASTTYTTVTSGASANTKGSWAELLASSAKDICGLLFSTFYPNGQIAVDIGTGAQGAETVLIPNFACACTAGQRFPAPVFIPVFIPRATRIAVRSQATAISVSTPVGAVLFQQPRAPNIFPPAGFPSRTFGAAEAAGFLTASTQGTLITANATGHVKGSWTELIASTARRVGYIIASFGWQSANDLRYLIDLGTGAAGSESVLVPDLNQEHSNTSSIQVLGFPVGIPAGRRIAARCQASTGSATMRASLVLLEVV